MLEQLRGIAPTHAIRGNIDLQSWASDLPATLNVDVHGQRFHVLHDIAELAVLPAPSGIAAIVFGHSQNVAAYAKVRQGFNAIEGFWEDAL